MEIHYVHGKNYDNNDPILRKVEEFCEYFNLKFIIREFDSYLFKEDRDYITELPAIQVYTRKYYEDTIYPSKSAIRNLQETYNKYDIAEMEWKAKKQIWENRIKYLKSKFCSLKTDFITSNQTV